jgi:CheY-like chemotaxis protein
MPPTSILVVDDEKNIRLTMSQALEPLNVPVQTAVNGEDALAQLEHGDFGLVFLDLKMPGMDGMEVLRRIRAARPRTRVVIITAHGTIGSAVEAMKLGAVDFIQKPFSPGEIRDLAIRVREREALEAEGAAGYHAWIELTKRHITDRSFAEAQAAARRAVAEDPAQPEAYNLLGALLEIQGQGLEAQRFYRAALDIDPTFKPAQANLERATSWHKFGRIDMGTDRPPEAVPEPGPPEDDDES